ncbi:MAG: hypothetical protein ACI9S9_004213, partial [Planctomycetota bacterium]
SILAQTLEQVSMRSIDISHSADHLVALKAACASFLRRSVT